MPFRVAGTVLVATGHGVEGQALGLHRTAESGGLCPHGLRPAVIIIQGVAKFRDGRSR